MSAVIEPTELHGDLVRLEPLGPGHCRELQEAVRDGGLHALWFTSIPEPALMMAEIERRLALQSAGTMIPYTVIRSADAQVLGMTTFCNIDRDVPRVEIGYTWLRASASGTGANADAKLLMLRHAFEEWGCAAVELRTHSMNLQSRAAIERLGASLDGVLRAHRRTANGALRNTCAYSITAPEWPAVMAGLESRVSRHSRRA